MANNFLQSLAICDHFWSHYKNDGNQKIAEKITTNGGENV